MQEKTTVQSLTELESYATELKALIETKKNYRNQIFFLEAQMGSGKTTLIRSLIKNFDEKLRVTSPTFIGMHLYETDSWQFYHYDLYQVGLNLEEFNEILDSEKQKLIFFEWSQNLDQTIKDKFKSQDTLVYNLKIDALENEDRVIALKL